MIVVIGCCRQKKGRGRDGGEGSSSGRWPQKEDTRRRQGERGGGRGRKDSNEEPIERTDIKKWDCRGTIEKVSRGVPKRDGTEEAIGDGSIKSLIEKHVQGCPWMLMTQVEDLGFVIVLDFGYFSLQPRLKA